MRVEVGYDVGFIGLPGASGYKRELVLIDEFFYFRNFFAGSHDVGNAVEACVARYCYFVDAYTCKQLLRSLVLHIYVCVALKHLAEHPSPRLEEYL